MSATGKMREEINLMRKTIREQRALLRTALSYIGVAAGAFTAAQPDKEHFSYPWRDSVTDALKVGREITEYLAKWD